MRFGCDGWSCEGEPLRWLPQTLGMIAYPAIDPVALRIGPLAIRWYGIAYLLGFLCAYGILRRAASRGKIALSRDGVGELLSALLGGVVIGGRLGYVLFYNLPYFWEHPLHIVAVWEGGMSFHGGLTGVLLAAWLFGRKRSIRFLDLGDALALAAPPGLFFGRLANFINGELFGRASDLPWATVFPNGGPLPRHPSELYEAVLEGLLLWLLVWWGWRHRHGRSGLPSGIFVGGYGVLRILVEFTREPDPQLGFVLGPFSMGQVLSAVLVLAGAAIVWNAVRTERS